MSNNYVEKASFVDEEETVTIADVEQVATVSDAIKSSIDLEKETAVDEEKVIVCDVETASIHQSSKPIAPDEKAIVEEEIRPGESGRVKFQSSWWPATSDQEMTFKPGEAVRVVAMDNVTLIVEG
jgi:NfeD-like C-terminal, partner-binding